MCDSVESCKNCIALRASNEQLKAELVSFQSLAQQCEDEAVDLRRQLCSALKDLANARKLAVAQQFKAGAKSDTLSESFVRTQFPENDMSHGPKVTAPRREGLRSSVKTGGRQGTSTRATSKSELGTGENCLSTPSPVKRKAELQVENQEVADSPSKRFRADEVQENQKVLTIDECLDCLKDLSAGWNERINATKRIGEICCRNEETIAPTVFDKIFAVFGIQVI